MYTDVSGNCEIAGWKDMEGSEGLERITDFFAAAGDFQAKPTRVSGGLDLLVINYYDKRQQVNSFIDSESACLYSFLSQTQLNA
jgi:hypothetical protein